MKAAIMENTKSIPEIGTFPEPQNNNELVKVNVSTVALENVDKLIFSGQHYTSSQFTEIKPFIPGLSGIGKLDTGETVSFSNLQPPYGSLAEFAYVSEKDLTYISEKTDLKKIDTVPKSAMTSAIPLVASKETLKEQVVLINGATGFAGQIAVQIAKHLGAKTIIATGRNKETLNKLLSLGADKVFNLTEEKNLLAKSIKNNRPHLIIDYLWGEPTELILDSLIPESFDFSTVTKLFQVGQSAGKRISIDATSIRTSGVEIVGFVHYYNQDTLKKAEAVVFKLLEKNNISVPIKEFDFNDISDAWEYQPQNGERVVININ